AITGYVRSATGADVGALTQDLSAATDVVSNIDHYDSELVTITGQLVGALSSGGSGFQRVSIATAGLAGNTNYQLRVPADVVDSIDMVQPCQFTVSRVPMGQYQAQAQIAAFRAADIQLRACPTPAIVSTVAISSTSLVLTFSRNIQPASVLANGSQFTFDHQLTATHAAVSGRTITLTTSAQTGSTAYTLTIASTVVDKAGGAVTPGSAGFAGFGSTTQSGAQLSVHTTLGIPGPLSATAPSDNFASIKPLYVGSYNGTRRVPNWISWELNTTYLGASDRQNDYRPDDTFPVTEPQADNPDYLGSGYERGHMCPSADRTTSAAANSQTFYLTNMVPQAANNNEGPWNDLEGYSRSLVTQGKELFVISGGIFSASSTTVGVDHVGVPDATWKVIVVLDSPTNPSPASVTTSTRVIAVIMPNSNALIGKNDPWRTYRTTVAQIEAKTGLNLLSDVDPTVQAVVEARVDNQ
ncbi:MAG TPA: DNA/RNA non-specific endonuclease, partial [Kofleriaceae bacterium]